MVKSIIRIFTINKICRALLLMLVFSCSKSWGQIAIPNTTPLTENFDAMAASATAALPANWKMSTAGAAAPTWTAAGNFTAVNFQASSGAPATGGRYNWGTTPATDRALGIMTSGSYASPNSIMAFYQNTNASNLTQLTVSYDLERYRINTAAASVQFFYSLDGFTWVSVAAGDIAGATIGTGASAYSYAPHATFAVGAFNITGINIANSGNIYLRWNLNTTGTNSQGIGVDNVSVTAAFTAPCTPPTTTVTPTTQTLCANTTATVFVSSSATIPTYQWQMSANGTSGWANVSDGTPTGVTYGGATSASLTATGTSTAQYFYQCLVTENGTCTATTNTVSITINASPSITSQPASVSTTSTSSGSFTVGAIGGALTYQWQENTGSGFANVSNGGSNPTYAGATNSVLTISNPPLSMSGYSYQCIVSNACGTATTNGTSTLSVTLATACPQIKGVFVNACDGSCSEGDNEIVFFNSGGYSLPVTAANIILKYENVTPPTVTYSDAFTTNAGQISNLNTLAGCPGLFVDASVAGTIPANSTFMMTRSTSCFNFDFSSYCGLGPIYVLFSTDASWLTGGNFVNGAAAGVLRYFRTDFSAVTGGCIIDYSYEPFLLVGSDGAGISFPDGGGAADSYFNNGCTPPKTILPIELVDFYATQNGEKNELIWKVASENEIRNYIIEKSEDGVNWYHLSLVTPKGSTESNLSYSMEDLKPYDGITYYRLSTLESDWSVKHYKIISLDRNDKSWKPLLYQYQDHLFVEFKNLVPKNSIVNVYDLSGQLLIEQSIADQQTKISTQNLAFGIYFVRISSPYKSENFKIVISK